MDGDDLIKLDSLPLIMTDFSLITGIVFMHYDQYLRGDVIRKNDQKALKMFTDYIQNKLVEQGGDGKLIRESTMKPNKREDD